MIKSDWIKALKEMQRLLDVANTNVRLAQNQVEELMFNIANYNNKIKEL